jgi:protein-S-isoprenylcysteine O-methyltransferase Ste14
LTDLLAIITVILWPVIPLFWIPVHGLSKIFKRLGLLTYITPLITWLPLVYIIYQNRIFLLQFKIDLPVTLNIIGILLFVIGTLLHIWTGLLLGLWGLVGLPEISSRIKGKLITEGPFSVVRHPTYLAHTLMFSGVFLITGVITVAIITLLDFLIINVLIIPLEEKELSARFGEDYKIYKKEVPSRFFPWIKSYTFPSLIKKV